MNDKPRSGQARLMEIPSVREILDRPEVRKLYEGRGVGRGTVRKAVQSVLERQRGGLVSGERERADTAETLGGLVREEVGCMSRRSLRRVVNATGVVLHTNLGRAPLAEAAMEAVVEVARGYCNLEFDLEEGRRGYRHHHVERLLRELTGAEAALVVNNNAAAVLLALRALAKGKEVIVSRGELVEIGGSFRIPDILKESGATLVEVGTTNRTHLRDYEAAVGSSTGLLLKVHPSNYRIEGFHKEVALEDMVSLGRRYEIPVMQDLGSGCLIEPAELGLSGEPTVREVVQTGVDVVAFSGDKLLGGPQAGILLGRSAVMQRIQSHPLIRALRMDKLGLAALEATLMCYRDGSYARGNIPALAMLAENRQALMRRAAWLAKRLKGDLPSHFSVRVCESTAMAGGGSLPMEGLLGPAVAVKSASCGSDEILSRLRRASIPVIARIERDEVLIDVRTLLKGEPSLVVGAFAEAFLAP